MKSLLSLGLVAALMAPPPAFAGDVFRQDVSGADGQDDPDGYPDWSGTQAPLETPGMPGGSAQEITERGRLRKQGWAAGKLHLMLSVEGDKVTIEGDRYEPEQNHASFVTGSVALRADSSLQFYARGGNGGNGGDGGDGQMGGRGRDGTDAERPDTEATDGTNGAPGGFGGDATNGGHAGPGGEIILKASIKDTDTFMIVDRTDVSGATGGRAGTPGAGGAGGPGGSGGAGASWTTQDGPEVKTGEDEQGNDIMEPSEVSHSLDPGDNGRPGAPGIPSLKSVYDGEDSGPGEVAFDVTDEKGRTRRYKSVYRLALLPGFTMEGSHNGVYTDEEGSFFEPGEKIAIRNLRVKNVGGMPTPKYQALKLFIGDNEYYVRSNREELSIPEVLEPNDEYSFGDQEITFHLAEKDRDVAGPLEIIDRVRPGAYVDRIRRRFPNFADGAERDILVQYPIRARALQSMRSLKPGETQKVRFEIANLSDQRIGRNEIEQALRYARTEFVRVGGKTESHHVVFTSGLDEGAVNPEEGIKRDINVDFLPPKGKMIIETYVGLSPNARPWSDVRIRPFVVLESILQKPKHKVIQFDDFFIRVGEEYKYTPNADILFIANHALNAEVLVAIKALAAVKHLTLDVWDFSRTGFFNFSHNIQDYGPIFEAYRGKTVMIMGNSINTPGGDVHAHRLINPDEVIEAARRYGIKIVVLDPSSDRESTVGRLTEPLPLHLPIEDPGLVRKFDSFKAYEKEIRANVNEVQEEKGDETSFLGTWQINQKRTYWWPWAEPSESDLNSAALKALETTEMRNPESQMFADLNFAPEFIKRRGFILPQYDLGSVNLRRGPDDSKTSVVAIRVPSSQLERPSYFTGPEFSTAFDLGLNFETKLKLLNEIMLGEYEKQMGREELPQGFENLKALEPMKYAQILVDSLFLDLINEQNQIRPLANRTKIPRKKLWDKLDLLKKLTHGNYDQYELDPSTPSGRIFVQFLLKMRFYNRAITTWADRAGAFWPFKAESLPGLLSLWPLVKEGNHDVSLVTAEMLNVFVGKIFKNAPAARELIETELAGIRKQASSDGVKRATIMDFVDPQGLNKATTRDGDVHRKFEERVRNGERQAVMLRTQAVRAERGMDIKAAVDQETATLLLDQDSCGRVLAQLPQDHALITDQSKDQNHDSATLVITNPLGIPQVPIAR